MNLTNRQAIAKMLLTIFNHFIQLITKFHAGRLIVDSVAIGLWHCFILSAEKEGATTTT